MKVLLTGITGFTGSHLADYLLKYLDVEIHALVRHSAGRMILVSDPSRIILYSHDFTEPLPSWMLDRFQGIDYIIHCGANVNAFRSLTEPSPVMQSNIIGTFNMLEAARILKPKTFLYVSSAEVLGGILKGGHKETAPLNPANPYSASKASGELLCNVYQKAFGVPTVIVRTMNIFGPRQDTTKFLPNVIKKILNNETISCHVDENGVPGSRQWIHVSALVKAMVDLLQSRVVGQAYHIVGPEMNNLDVIARAYQALDRKFSSVILSQPNAAHVMRYALRDNSDVQYEILNTAELMTETVKWYAKNPEWLV